MQAAGSWRSPPHQLPPDLALGSLLTNACWLAAAPDHCRSTARPPPATCQPTWLAHPGDEIVKNFYKFAPIFRGQTIFESFARLKYFYKGIINLKKIFT